MTNQYEITFVADTATALANISRLEAELNRLGATANAANTAANSAAGGVGGLGAQASATAGHVEVITNNLGSMNSSLLNLSNALQVVQVAAQVAFAFGEKLNSARKEIQNMTDDAMKLRDTLREIANLQGKNGPDESVARDVLKLGIAGGMMPKEAKEYMEQFLGSVPAGKTKGNITDPVAEEVAREGAKFATRVGINAKTGGDFAGVMSQYQKIPDVKTAAKVMGQVVYGLNEGRGNVEPLMRTLLTTAGSLVQDGGPMENLAELAVMEGVASTHANPYATGTRLRQAVRALRETKGPQGAWLAQQGVKDGMSHLQRLKAIKPALMTEVAKGKGLDQALKEFVTGDDTEARSIAEQLGDIDLMDARLAKANGITGEGVMDANTKFLTRNAVGRDRVSKANAEAQKFLIGDKFTNMTIAMNNAEQVMRDQHEIGGAWNTGKEWVQDAVGLAWLGKMGFRDKRKLGHATGELIKEARRVGLSDKEIFVNALKLDRNYFHDENDATLRKQYTKAQIQTMNWNNFSGDRELYRGETQVKEDYSRLSQAVERKGGNISGPMPDLGAKLDAVAKNGEETNRILRNLDRNAGVGGVARGIPAKPVLPTPPARQGAAAPKRP